MKLIVAIDENNGIGKNNSIPWDNKEELQHFKNTTWGHYCLFGYNTAKTLPKLKGRGLFVLTSRYPNGIIIPIGNNKFTVVSESHIKQFFILDGLIGQETFICGGAKLYEYVLENRLVTECVISRIDGEYDCDVFFPSSILEKHYKIMGEERHEKFTVERWGRNENRKGKK